MELSAIIHVSTQRLCLCSDPSLKIGPVLEMCLWKMSSKPSLTCIYIHMGQISLVSVMWLYLYFVRFLLTVENRAQ